MAYSIQAGFEDVLSILGLTNRQQQLALDRHSAISKFFSTNFEMRHDVFPVGSYARKTVAREKDIDFMAIMQPFGAKGYWGTYQADSSGFLYKVRNELNDHYGRTSVSSKQVAVKLDFSEIVTDITPGFPRKGGGFLIPDGKGKWQGTNPVVHMSFMDEADQLKGYRLKKIVQLLKYWNTQNGGHLMSFHLELLTELTYRNGTIATSWGYAIKEGFRCMPTWLGVSTSDPWSHGSAISTYLSTAVRDKVLKKLERSQELAEQALAAEDRRETRQAFELWDEVFNDGFAAYG